MYSATEATRNIMQAWGVDSISERTVQCWFVRFSAWDFNLEDTPCGGRPSSIDNEVLKDQIESDPPQTVHELAIILNVQHKTNANHLHRIAKCGSIVVGFHTN